MPIVENLVPHLCELGEGPYWSPEEQCLYHFDYRGSKIFRFDPKTKENKCLELEGDDWVSMIVPVEGKPNQFVIARSRHLFKLYWNHLSGESHCQKLLTVEKQENTLNDGKCDPSGRLWIGSFRKEMGDQQTADGSLFRVTLKSGNATATQFLSKIGISNGLCWSNDKQRMYYIDTMARSVYVLDYDDVTGSVANCRVLFDFAKNETKGFPDGMTIDTHGHLWVACFKGSQVIEIDPGNNEANSGTLVSTIHFPALNITSVTFGGSDYRDLYVTSAKWGDDDTESKTAGSLFRVSGVAQGMPDKKLILE